MKNKTNPIRVLLVDDHQILLDGLKNLLEKESNILLKGCFYEQDKALQFIQENNGEIDVAVLDISMNKESLAGLRLCQEIKTNFPHIHVLIMTMHEQAKYITPLVRAGANGYILKEKGQEELLEAIETLAKGEDYYGKAIVKTVMDTIANRVEADHGVVKLTSREIDVLKLIGKGYSSKQVAENLFIEASTVESHKNHIREKLDLKNVKEIIIFARENGYVEDE
jgi:two-component system nitrate/nitrite response regulator NarL